MKIAQFGTMSVVMHAIAQLIDRHGTIKEKNHEYKPDRCN